MVSYFYMDDKIKFLFEQIENNKLVLKRLIRNLILSNLIIFITFIFFFGFYLYVILNKDNVSKICSYDLYNCNSFESQEEAQTLYDLCIEYGTIDIHRLDNNNNGVACESFNY